MGEPAEILVRRGEAIRGPLTAKQVRKLIAKGRLLPADSVSVAAGPWVRVADYLGAPQPASRGAHVADQWFYTLGETKRGPVSGKKLKELARNGRLQPGDLVRKDEAKHWRRADKIRGLFAAEPAEVEVPVIIPKEMPETISHDANGIGTNAANMSETDSTPLAKPKPSLPFIIVGVFGVVVLCAGLCLLPLFFPQGSIVGVWEGKEEGNEFIVVWEFGADGSGKETAGDGTTTGFTYTTVGRDIDFVHQGPPRLKLLGIYTARGDSLKLAISMAETHRPRNFEGHWDLIYTLTRKK